MAPTFIGPTCQCVVMFFLLFFPTGQHNRTLPSPSVASSPARDFASSSLGRSPSPCTARASGGARGLRDPTSTPPSQGCPRRSPSPRQVDLGAELRATEPRRQSLRAGGGAPGVAGGRVEAEQ